jgi:iron-sulfur cluster assembly protein
MILLLSEAAINQLKKTVTEVGALGVRAGVQGGGCSGFTYVLRLANEGDAANGDLFVEDHEGLKVYIDQMSAMYLEGTTLDYITSDFQSGFKFENPQVKHTCGCGQSFSY